MATRGVLEGYSRGLGFTRWVLPRGVLEGYSVRALEVERERVRERRDVRRGLDEHKALRDLGADLLIGARYTERFRANVYARTRRVPFCRGFSEAKRTSWFIHSWLL